MCIRDRHGLAHAPLGHDAAGHGGHSALQGLKALLNVGGVVLHHKFGDLEGVLARVLQLLEPVSYTHLDVYKRQTDPNSVRLGSKVKVLDLEFEEEESYQVVGSQEADPMNGRISEDSPFGKALLGNAVGDRCV